MFVAKSYSLHTTLIGEDIKFVQNVPKAHQDAYVAGSFVTPTALMWVLVKDCVHTANSIT